MFGKLTSCLSRLLRIRQQIAHDVEKFTNMFAYGQTFEYKIINVTAEDSEAKLICNVLTELNIYLFIFFVFKNTNTFSIEVLKPKYGFHDNLRKTGPR